MCVLTIKNGQKTVKILLTTILIGHIYVLGERLDKIYLRNLLIASYVSSYKL